jgi:RecB family exonuclease
MLIVGFSRIKSWRRCHRLWWYKYVEGLVRRRPAVPLIRGTIIHALFDAKAKKKAIAQVLQKYQQEFGKLFLEQREEYGDLIGDCKRIFENYQRTYVDDKYKIVGSEIEVKVDLVPGIEFQGHIDKIWLDTTPRRWIVDYKTHKNILGDEQRFNDVQLVFYPWAWNSQNKKAPVDGVIWDYIRTKSPAIPEVLKNGTLSKRANIDTDYATAIAAVTEYLKKPAAGDSMHNYAEWLADIKARENKFFKRVFLPSPSRTLIDNVVIELITTAKEILSSNGAQQQCRTMTKDCSWCEYYQLCSAELRGQDSDFVRKTEFKINEKLLNEEDDFEED